MTAACLKKGTCREDRQEMRSRLPRRVRHLPEEKDEPQKKYGCSKKSAALLTYLRSYTCIDNVFSGRNQTRVVVTYTTEEEITIAPIMGL
jgi:hypothetical protein